MLGEIRPEFQCLEGSGENSNVWKNNGRNFSVLKDKVRIPMFGRIRSHFQGVERKGLNSSVWKDKVRILMFGRIRSEFQCLDT